MAAAAGQGGRVKTWCVVERASYLVGARSPGEAERKLDKGVVVKGSLCSSVRGRAVIERCVTEVVCGQTLLPGVPLTEG